MQNFSGIYALGAVLEMIHELGPDRIEQRIRELGAYGCRVLRGAGGELDRDRLLHYDSPILAARFPGRDVAALAAGLRDQRVVVAVRHGCLRVSPHFFNNEEDLDRLGECVADILSRER